MDPANTVEQILVLKRFETPPPGWSLWLPVGGVLLLYLILMYQRGRQAGGSFWSSLPSRLLGPPWALAMVLAGCAAYLFLGWERGGNLLAGSALSWWFLLGPVVIAGLFYIGLMYYRDARSVGPVWATLLGLLRGAVYVLLAGVFVLPAWQTSTTTTTRSKIVVLFDVSASMLEVDDLPEAGQDLSTLLKRQDKVIRFLTDGQSKFLRDLQKTNPVTCYRFGRGVDETPRTYPDPKEPRKRTWTKRELDAWLKIDPNQKGLDEKTELLHRRLYAGTNIGDSLTQVLNKEAGNMVQAIILVSDGQQNEGKEQAYLELRTLAEKAKVPIMCIGVGKYRPPVNIKLNDIEAPAVARPDDPFTVQVPVVTRGVKEPYDISLEVSRVQDGKGNAIKGETYPVMVKKGTPKEGEAERTEFEINVAELKKIDPRDDTGALEGTWEFKAKVPRDKGEVFAKPLHVTDQPARTKITKKKLRVLLLAGGPSKEYQFVKNIFYREAIEKRAEVGVYLQTNDKEEIDLDEDKPQMWILDHFPEMQTRGDTAANKPYVLFEYDLVIAFDPDWSAIPEDALKLLKKWVTRNYGGLVLVGDVVNTYQLARPPKEPDLKPILDLYPVTLDDARLMGLSEGFNPTTKYPLKFTGADPRFDFLKLDENGEGTTAGWNEFFYDTPTPEKDTEVERGFYTAYPVKDAKSVATVIAEFPVDKNAGVGKGDVPYMVYMKPGNGQTMFIGSQELWRLRQYKEAFHDRFWIRLARFIGSGLLGRLQKYGEDNIPDRMTVGDRKRIEYRLWGLDRNAFPRSRAPELKVYLRRYNKIDDPKPDPKSAEKIDIQPKPGRKDRTGKEEESGWFIADFSLKKPGKYEFELKIPGTPETLRKTVIVDQPNPELDVVKPDLLRLYRLAQEGHDYHPVQMVLNRVVDDRVKRQVRELRPPREVSENPVGKGDSLYFDLESAPLIPRCMITDKDEKETKGEALYLWDQGWESEWVDPFFGWEIKFAYVLTAVVVLLSLEWLIRKLLKLA
jgi:hypothetical protein